MNKHSFCAPPPPFLMSEFPISLHRICHFIKKTPPMRRILNCFYYLCTAKWKSIKREWTIITRKVSIIRREDTAPKANPHANTNYGD